MVEAVTAGRKLTRRSAPGRRSVSALAAGLLALTLSSCDALPGMPDASPSDAPPSAQPMDPASVASAESSSVDPSWLCQPGAEDSPLPPTTDGGAMIPETVSTEGNDITVSGPFQLEPEHSYTGFVPEGLVAARPSGEPGRTGPGVRGPSRRGGRTGPTDGRASAGRGSCCRGRALPLGGQRPPERGDL